MGTTRVSTNSRVKSGLQKKWAISWSRWFVGIFQSPNLFFESEAIGTLHLSAEKSLSGWRKKVVLHFFGQT